MRIGLDVMGGDFEPSVNVKGAIMALKDLPSGTTLVLFGDQDKIKLALAEENQAEESFEIVHCTEVIGMGEHPIKAFRAKQDSTISVGFKYLKEKKLDAFSGTGNTGAMLVASMYAIRAISGVIRPCITSVLPKENGGVNIILDVGTNSDCKPDVLYQFGLLGSMYAELIFGIKNPKVGLLNIGEEEEKGNLLTQASYVMMKDNKDYNFIGNVEGRDLFTDKCDVVVCDGFTGNVVLKTAEAFYSLIKKRNLVDDYFGRFNYEIYGGTPILGIDSNVIIGHGSSSSLAIKNMLILSRDVAEANLSTKIKNAFA